MAKSRPVPAKPSSLNYVEPVLQRKHTGTLQRAAVNAEPTNDVPPVVHEVLRSPGQPLDAQTRAFMEPRFGHDFSGVRVHTDEKAAQSAQAVNALAYTVGNHVAFAGRHRPQSSEGRRLMAHELAHVVQQARVNKGISSVSEANLEHDAESAAQSISHSGRPIQVAQASSTRIARQKTATDMLGGSQPVQARYQVTETPLPYGRVRIRVWGTVGDPITRPGLEKKYPLPKDVGLPGYDRWHLAGPDAMGAEEGIVYAPKNFNVSKTAEIENIVRKARVAVREQGGDVHFDFTAECRVAGEHEGVQIRVLEKATWQVEVRPAGTDKVISVVNETASPTVELNPAGQPTAEKTPSAPATNAKPESAVGSSPAASKQVTSETPSAEHSPQPAPKPAPAKPSTVAEQDVPAGAPIKPATSPAPAGGKQGVSTAATVKASTPSAVSVEEPKVHSSAPTKMSIETPSTQNAPAPDSKTKGLKNN